jgi:hypothetical protein
MKHRVEGNNLLHLDRMQAQQLGDFADYVAGQKADFRLSQMKRAHEGRAWLREFLDLTVDPGATGVRKAMTSLDDAG